MHSLITSYRKSLMLIKIICVIIYIHKLSHIRTSRKKLKFTIKSNEVH